VLPDLASRKRLLRPDCPPPGLLLVSP